MKRGVFVAPFMLTVAAFLVACGSKSGSFTPAPAVPTAAISANPTTIASGQPATLTWSCTNATSATASGDWAGMTLSGTSGTATVKPAANATYALVCTGSGGSASASATVTVNPAAVTVSSVALACNPTSINTSQTSQCTGTVTNSDGSTDHNVTYATSLGAITSSGVLSSSSAGTANVTATSAKDSTKYATTTVNVTAAVVSVYSVSTPVCTPSSITTGQTSQCASTVTYSDGSTDHNVTWSTSLGSITSSGVLSSSSAGTANVTATSAKDSTKSATTTGAITVTLAPIVIDSITPNMWFNGALLSPALTVTGSGFADGEIFSMNGVTPLTLASISSTTSFQFLVSSDLRPRFIDVYGTQADGTGKSNTIPFAELGTAPLAAPCNDYIFADDPGDGIVRRFSRADGSHIDFNAPKQNIGIATDCNADGTTNFVVINYKIGLEWLDKNGNYLQNGGGASDNNSVSGAAANEHVACAAEPSIHEAWCAQLIVGISTQKFSPAIGVPIALDMTGAGGGNTLYVLDGQGDGTNLVLYSFSVGSDGTISSQRSVPIPGLTAGSHFTQSQLNWSVNWQMAASQSSSMVAVKAPVLNNSDGSVGFALALVDGSTMSVVASGVALPPGSFRIAEDDVHNATEVHVADLSGTPGTSYEGVNRIWSRPNTATGTLVKLSSTSNILAAGSVLSSDGSTNWITGWDPKNDAAGLQLQAVPNQ